MVKINEYLSFIDAKNVQIIFLQVNLRLKRENVYSYNYVQLMYNYIDRIEISELNQQPLFCWPFF